MRSLDSQSSEFVASESVLFEHTDIRSVVRILWHLALHLKRCTALVYAVAGRRNAAKGRRDAVAEQKKKSAGALHGSLIEDYCMIGDCETAALVSREGSIDWLCWPTFSSAACFAALLGTRDHGYWKISPAGKVKAMRRQYEAHTLVVETSFETKDGEVCLVDFMPPRAEHSHVVRMVRGVRGKVAMQMDLAIRFDYGRTIPWVTSTGS